MGGITDFALEDICTDANNIIFFPAYSNDTWHFDAMGNYSILGEFQDVVKDEEWNLQIGTRMTDAGLDDNISFQVHNISTDYKFENLGGRTCFYLYTDYVGTDIAENIKANMTVIDERTYEYQGWLLHRIMFKTQ